MVMYQRKCSHCSYETAKELNEPIIHCSLNSAMNLSGLLGGQHSFTKCEACENGQVRSQWQIMSTGDILVVYYSRHHNLKESILDRTKAPAVRYETLSIGDSLYTYELRSFILHTPRKCVKPDSEEIPFQAGDRLDKGHYSCIQLESVSSSILHNDDILQRINGFNVVANYAGKIVMAFYMKV